MGVLMRIKDSHEEQTHLKAFDTASRTEALSFIAQMLPEVRDCAIAHKLKFLAYLVDMAILETAELRCKAEAEAEKSQP